MRIPILFHAWCPTCKPTPRNLVMLGEPNEFGRVHLACTYCKQAWDVEAPSVEGTNVEYPLDDVMKALNP